MENNPKSSAGTYNMNQNGMNGNGKCPFSSGIVNHSAGKGTSNREWWPNMLNLGVLRQHSSLSDPMAKWLLTMRQNLTLLI